MSRLILPRRLTEQPQSPVRVDRSHSAGQNLVIAAVPTAAKQFVELVRGCLFSDSYAEISFVTTGFRAEGRWRKTRGGSYRNTLSGPGNLLESSALGAPTGAYTMLLLCRPQYSSTSVIRIAGVGANSDWDQTAISIGDGTNARFSGYTSLSTRGFVAADADYTVGQFYAVAFTCDLINGVQRLFVNGSKQSGSSTWADTSTPHWGLNNVFLSSGATSAGVEIYGLLSFNRVLLDGEIASLSANPWQVFQAPPRKFWVVPDSAPAPDSQYLHLVPQISDSYGCVKSATTHSGDLTFTGKIKTLSQQSATPNPWDQPIIQWNVSADGTTGYMLQIKTDGVSLNSISGTELKGDYSVPYPVGVERAFSITQSGGSIAISLDGVSVLTYTDAAPVTSGYIILSVSSSVAAFDDLGGNFLSDDFESYSPGIVTNGSTFGGLVAEQGTVTIAVDAAPTNAALAWLEDNDICEITGEIPTVIMAAWLEVDDVLTLGAKAKVTTAVEFSEEDDVLAAEIHFGIAGEISYKEVDDAFSLGLSAKVNTELAFAEVDDILAINVESSDIAVDLAITAAEEADNFALEAKATVRVIVSPLETNDVFSMTLTAPVKIGLSWKEEDDFGAGGKTNYSTDYSLGISPAFPLSYPAMNPNNQLY